MPEIRDDIPPPTNRKGPTPKYAFRQLKPGQSLIEEAPPGVEFAKHVTRVRAAVVFHGKSTGQVFLTRVENGQLRIWRVE